MAFESGVIPKDWRSAVIVPLTRGKRRGLNIGIIEALTNLCLNPFLFFALPTCLSFFSFLGIDVLQPLRSRI